MNKLFYFVFLLFTSLIFSQNSVISYQAIIYAPGGQNLPGVNVNNVPMVNKNICLQFSFFDSSNIIEYKEVINVRTDEFGMVNINIGLGTQTGGYASNFNGIVWNALAQKSLKVDLDSTGSCNQFLELTNQPMASVPFANASITAGNVSGVVALLNGGTGATTVAGARANLSINNVDNTSDANKPISTATQIALDTKETLANKSTSTTLGTSDVLFPTQNAVKTYVDTQVTSTSIADASTTVKGKIQLAGDLGGTAGAPTVPGLALKANTSDLVTGLATKEDIANKSTTTTLGTSDVLFPTQNAVKTYVDTQVASVTIADATTTVKGKIQLAGDLGGTAGAPTVPGLALKANTSDLVTGLATKEDIANKSTTTTLGTSDVLFPTQNAVKTYVDTQVASVTIADATTTVKGKIQLAGDLGGTAGAPTVPGLALKANTSDLVTGLATKEDIANKSTTTTLGTSDVLFPTQNAVKTYVDTQVASATIADASTTVKGKIQLAGDLGGTAALPVVATGAITTAKLADDAVTSAKITDGTIVVGDLADNAVESAKIKAAAVTNAKLDKANIPLSGFGAAAAAIDLGSNKLTNVTDPTAAQDAATKNYVDSQITAGVVDATTTVKGKIQLAGDLTGTADLPAVATGAITSTKLANDAVTTVKITDANVTYAKIQNVSATDKVLGRVSSGAGVIEEIATTGSGDVVRATSPTLVTPVLGVATATSINSTTIPTSKTLVVTTDKLNVMAATTSAELAGVISDETGTGSLVLSVSPTFTGTPLAPTAAASTNTTQVATTEFVTSAVTTANATNANLTGMVTSVGNATTVVTNANLTGEVTSTGNATTVTNAAVIGKVLTGYTAGAGTVAATDTILQAIQKIDGNDALKAPLASPTFTGTPLAPTAAASTNTTQVATTEFVTSAVTTANATNANLTGEVTSTGNATTVTNAAVIGKVLTGYTAGAGTVAATDTILQAIQKIDGNDALKAPLASPTFTGTPLAPTAAASTNTTQVATTEFVTSAVTTANATNANLTGMVTSVGNATTVVTNANLTGEVTSTGNATTVTNAAVIGKVLTGYTAGAGTVAATDTILQAIQKIDGNDALKAPLASPTFTGTPLAPTAAESTNTTQVATTEFVTSAVTTANATNANLTGMVTSVGNATTVVTNANLTGEVTSTGNATTVTNAAVIGKVLTGYTAGAGTVAATDTILQAIQKIDGNDALKAPLASPTFTGTPLAPTAAASTNTTQVATTEFVTSAVTTANATNANLTGMVTSVGNATSLGSFTSANLATALSDETGSGVAVLATSPTLVTPVLGVATATSINSTTIPTSKTLVVTTDKLNVMAATTSAELAGVISDETGTGSLVLSVSPTFTGTPLAPTAAASTNTTQVATTEFVTSAVTTANATNANLTGEVTSTGNATTVTNAAVIGKVLTGYTAGAGTVAATDTILQAIQKIDGNDALKAPLASPTFTGTPLAPTAAASTNTTQVATTEFVTSAVTTANATNANLTGMVTSVGNATSLGSFTSANLATALSDETGSGVAVLATSPTLVTPVLGVATATSINSTTIPTSKTLVVTTDKLNVMAATTSAELAGVISDETGTGSLVLSVSPTFTGTPLAPTAAASTNTTQVATTEFVTSAVTTANATNANLTGMVTSVGNATSLGSFTSANLATALTDETGSGVAVLATSPTLVTPVIGAATGTSLSVSGQLTSTLATGTAPLVVTSTTPVANLNIGGNAATVTTNANLTGDVTSTGNATTVVKINGTSLAGLSTGILKNTTSTGVPSIAVAADFPTLNQNTTGTAANVSGTVGIANGGTGSTTKNFVDLTNDQTIAGVKTFSGSSTVVQQNLTVNSAGTMGQGIILSDDGDIVDNNDGAATFRFGAGIKINNGNKSAGTTTNITLTNTGNISATGNISGNQITSTIATGTAPLVVTSTTPVANLSIGGNAATATKLATARKINTVDFDGSADITVTAAAGTLTGTTLASNVVNSSLTSVGTIATGTWNGTTIAIANGGTGQTTKAAAFDALSPMTTAGDIIYGGTSGTGTRLPKGTDGQVLTLASGVPAWSSNSNGGASLISATATMAATDTYNLIVFSGSTAGQTITLPSAITVGAGREITIKNIASVSVSVASAAGNLISDSTTTGATSLSIGVEPSNNWIKAISTGANWIILRGLF